MSVIDDIRRYLEKNEKKISRREEFYCITHPEIAFETKYPNFSTWGSKKFERKLEQYLKKEVEKAIDNFIGFYYSSFSRDRISVPSISELKEEVMKKVEYEIRSRYNHFREQNERYAREERESKRRERPTSYQPQRERQSSFQTQSERTSSNGWSKPTYASTSSSYQTKRARTSSESRDPFSSHRFPSTSSSFQTPSSIASFDYEERPHIESKHEKITFDGFIDFLREIYQQGENDRRIKKVLDLADQTPTSIEEIATLRKKIHTAINQLFFNKNVRKRLLQKYGTTAQGLLETLCNQWERKYERTMIEEEEPEELHLRNLTTELFEDTSPSAKELWDLINATQRDVLTTHERRKRIQEKIIELFQKDPVFREKMTKRYRIKDVEAVAKKIGSEWETKVRENGGQVWDRVDTPKRAHSTIETPVKEETPGFAEMAFNYIHQGSEFETVQQKMTNIAETDDIASYIFMTDEIIKEYVDTLKQYLEHIKKESPEVIEALMRLVEEVYGVVLNNECEIDAFVEMIESELHYNQMQIGLEKGASIERLTELETHNARKIEREYAGAPIIVREFIVKEDPNYGFDTSQEIFVSIEGMPLPEDYGERFIIGTHFRKSLYDASLKKTEESGEDYQVDFQRKNWTLSIQPNMEIAILDEEGNEVEVDSYLLIEVQREITNMANKKKSENQY